MGTVSKSTVRPIFGTVTFGVSFIYTSACLIISQMVTSLGIAGSAVKKWAIVSIGAYSSCFIIFCTVNIWAIRKCSVTFFNRSPASLVQKMPIEAGKRSVLLTFVLKKALTLLCSEFFQIHIMMGLFGLN